MLIHFNINRHVDEVWSKLSHKAYARKRFRRFKHNQHIQESFARELNVLKKFSHQHLVKVMGSYTDKECLAYLMEPVADCDLMTYLNKPGGLKTSDLVDLRKSVRSRFRHHLAACPPAQWERGALAAPVAPGWA